MKMAGAPGFGVFVTANVTSTARVDILYQTVSTAPAMYHGGWTFEILRILVPQICPELKALSYLHRCSVTFQ